MHLTLLNYARSQDRIRVLQSAEMDFRRKIMSSIKNLISALCSVVLAGVVGLSSPVIASTPDGETPANEGVCDPLKLDGITKGLYGLCVAYCEAQDLDVVGDKEPPNSKILGNYRKKMNPGDPDMPCLATPCPCWDEAEIAAVANSGTAICNSTATIGQIRNASVFAQIDTARPLCRYVDRDTATQRMNADFTAEEAQSCYSIVIDACAAIGQ